MGLVSLGAEVAPASRWQFPLLIFSGCPALPECGGGSRCEAWRRGEEQRSAQARGGVRGPATGEGMGGEGRVCRRGAPLPLGLGCFGEGSLGSWLDGSWGISPLLSP